MITIYRLEIFGLLLNIICLINCDNYDSQPKILNENGTLIFETAKDRNITFRTSGRSSIKVNNIEVMDAIMKAENRISFLKTHEQTTLEDTVNSLLTEMSSIKGISGKINSLENATRTQRRKYLQVDRMKRTVARIASQVAAMENKTRNDDCRSAPCKNGGTCLDLYDNFYCICPKNWKGKACDVDVDECTYLAGTELGCQNNARCINTAGGYRCECSSGWVGVHCTLRKIDCASTPNSETCVHGTCVEANNDAGYTCICEQGWTTNGTSPSCIIDIDECIASRTPCVSDCINTPGSFTCGPCPQGYTGNGISCTDIDECRVDNGGCSLAPTVLCINTEGSYQCDSCPPGWTGDGKTCTRYEISRCATQSICHPLATCSERSNRVVCTCTVNTTGSGYGPNGCMPINTQNQNCTLIGSERVCSCLPGFDPPLCTPAPDSCRSSPCQNGGTCISLNRFAFRCRCANQFYGRFCGRRGTGCGGVLVANSGVLKYPGNETYQNNKRCAWVIRTDNDKVLNVTFTNFALEPSRDCSYDWLQIHDGRSSQHTLIGRFCGHELPKGGNIISTHNQLYLWFRSDNSSQFDGFELTWNSITPLCGGEIDTKSNGFGLISSPGLPGKAPPSRICEWQINAPPSTRLRLVFYSLTMGVHQTCDAEYLAIYEDTTLLNKYCNSTLPEPYVTPSHEITIRFRTDEFNFDSSFQIHYNVIPGLPGCGGVYTSYTGEFGSPLIDGQYPNNIVCDYEIKIPFSYKISLSFSKFDIEHTYYCDADFVEIFEKRNNEEFLDRKLCGYTIPDNFTSDSNELLVRFTTDGSIRARGFRLNYNIVCGGIYTTPGEEISSPLYPNKYIPSYTCKYSIEAPPNYVIRLDILDFEFEDGDSCPYDYLKIYNGIEDENLLIGKYCGHKSPFTITSTMNHLNLHFQSDNTDEFKGFIANYTFLNIGCGGVLKSSSGEISPPLRNEENSFLYGRNCTWIITAPQNKSIVTQFTAFDLPSSPYCQNDYLDITTFYGAHETKYRYCGNNVPPTITHQANKIIVVFSSMSENSIKGFNMRYAFINETIICGGNYTSSFGVIHSPGWPDNYFSEMTCVWILTAPLGRKIRLKVKSFELETPCVFDYLEIRNGLSDDSPVIGKYCGTEIPLQLTSLGNHMYLQFRSDLTTTYKGFDIEWNHISDGCGGIVNLNKGAILSPFYPQLFNDVAQCEWHIRVNAGSSILMNIQFATGSDCSEEFLYIYDGPTHTNKKITLLCNNTSDLNSANIAPIESSGNEVLVIFASRSRRIQNAGFKLEYSTNCYREIHLPYGVIESPNFPDKYPNDISCEWKIIAKSGRKISMAVSHFELEFREDSEEPCTLDFLEIFDIRDNQTYSRTKHCAEKPSDYTSVGNVLMLKFKTDYSIEGTGFRLEYKIDTCGEIIMRPSGKIGSLNYPNEDAINVDCEWIIQAVIGYSIRLTIEDLRLDSSRKDCESNGLIIANGRNSSNVIAEICETIKDNNYTVQSSGYSMYIRFHTDIIRAKKLFSASYSTQENLCGGQLKLPRGNIYSPNYPEKYTTHIYCEWLIETDEHHALDLFFNDYFIETNKGCNVNYLNIYEGNTSNPNALLMQYCNNSLPAVKKLSSITHQMLIIFSAGEDSKGVKLSLTYQRNCGKIINVYDVGQFTKHFDTNDCIWTLIAPDSVSHITLTFTHLQCGCHMNETQNNFNCDISSKIMVYDGPNINAPLKLEFCEQTPPAITSNGNALTIRAKQGHFNAFYSTYENACGGTLTAFHGKFASPMYPNSYPVNAECVWEIVARPGNTIQIQFESFDVAVTENCHDDFVEIRERNRGGRLIGVYCGKELPPQATSFERLWVIFRSDNANVAQGFIAEYKYAEANENSGTSGIITNPPLEGMQREDINYFWRINVERGNLILLQFERYFGGIRIYDGFDETALEIEISNEIAEITSNTNYIYISGNLKTLERFTIVWNAVPKISNITDNPNANDTCGGTIISQINTKINFTSPNYPNYYTNNLNCEWILKTSQLYTHIFIEVSDIQLEFSKICHDFISISISKDLINWELVKKICEEDDVESLKYYHGEPYMKIVFKTDASITFKGFVISVFEDCGSNITTSSGIIKGQDTYGFSSGNCIWSVRVRPGRKIKFTFDIMNLYEFNGKCTHFVQIRNGPDEESPILGSGNYCGTNNSIEIPLTSSNRAFVKFRQFNIKPYNFTLRFVETSIDCHNTITLTNDNPSYTITTPNYPNIPDSYTECTWIIIAPLGESINLTFAERFDLSKRNDCQDEFIEIRDGATRLSYLLTKTCRNPYYNQTTGNGLYLRYFTNIPIPGTGFKAIASIAKCGGAYHGSSGVVTSKGYPAVGRYPSNTVCYYYIYVRENHGINLTLDHIELPLRNNASNSDHINVYQTVYSSSQRIQNVLIAKLNNNNILKSLISHSNQVLLEFVTYNKTDRYSGFKIQFKDFKECGKNIVAPSGTLSSPTYPRMPIGRKFCKWSITVPKGRRIKLRILVLITNTRGIVDEPINIYADSSKQCTLASIYNRDQTYVYSSDNTMYLEFTQDDEAKIVAFNMLFSSTEESPCAIDASAASGSIILPADNKNFYCSHSFSLSGTETLAFDIRNMFNIPDKNSEYYCDYPWMIFKNDQYNIQEVCGNSSRTIVALPYRNTVVDIYRTDLTGNLTYDMNFKRHSCGGILNILHDMTILKPNFAFSYGSLDCAWHLKSSQYFKVFIKTRFVSNCNEQYMLLYNGDGPDSPRLQHFCGTNEYNHTMRQNAFITYHADSTAPDSSFDIQIKHLSDCGGQIDSPLSAISIDNYFYKNNTFCTWDIKSSNGYHLNLEFVDRFFIEESANCTKDYVEVKTFETEWKSLGRFCGREKPGIFNTSSAHIKVIFRTDDNIVGDGFTIIPSEMCGNTLKVTDKKEVLVSPHYPSNYNNNLNCTYTLRSPKNSWIYINITEFDLEVSTGCVKDNLTIYKNNSHDGIEEQMGSYCGAYVKREIRALEFISFTFRTDQFSTRKGFSLTYQIDNCGGTITQSSIIETPKTDSNNHPAHMTCTWNINAPEGNIIQISFNFLEFEYTELCRDDYIRISSPNSNLNPAGVTLCGNLTGAIAPIRINSNIAKIEAFTDATVEMKGFSAAIEIIKNCDIFVNLTAAKPTHNLIYNELQHDEKLDCNYRISVPVGFIVKLEFNQFNMIDCSSTNTTINSDNKNKCLCNYLQIREGINAVGDLLGNLCGTSKPDNIISGIAGLHLKLINYPNYQNNGFHITASLLQSPCGILDHHLQTNSSLLVISPGQTSYPPNTICTWNIESDKLMTIHFEKFDLQEPDDDDKCNDYLEIIDDGETHFQILELSEYINKRRYSKSFSSTAGRHTFCGNNTPTTYFTSFKRISIKFLSDKINEKSGFKLEITNTEGCRNYTNTYGRYMNRRLPIVVNCDLFITSPENYTLTLFFSDILFHRSDCTKNFIRIYDNNNSRLIKEICGMRGSHENIATKTNSLKIAFNFNTPVTSIQMTYLATDSAYNCGGQIYDTLGFFSSPNYPSSKTNETFNCRWDISVPQNKQIALAFRRFNIGTELPCNSSRVEIIEASKGSKESIKQQYCSYDKHPGLFVSERNTLTIVYVQSPNFNGDGFVAHFVSIDGNNDRHIADLKEFLGYEI